MKILHRYKKQNPPHVLIRIRKALNLHPKKNTDPLGISLDTFKNIVYHNPKSWDKHAAIVSRATGVAVKSLLVNNPRKPLLSVDGKRWTPQKSRLIIALRYSDNSLVPLTDGVHILQWFRILMIKVARFMLAAYQSSSRDKSDIAFFKLLQSVNEIGKSFPSYTAKVSYKHCFPSDYKPDPITEICWSEIWERELLRDVVGTIDRRSRQGMKIIFGRFLRDIIKEEKRQLPKKLDDIRQTLKTLKARAIASKPPNPDKPGRR